MMILKIMNGKTAVENKWDYLRCYSHQQNDDSENKYLSLYIYIYVWQCVNKYIYTL